MRTKSLAAAALATLALRVDAAPHNQRASVDPDVAAVVTAACAGSDAATTSDEVAARLAEAILFKAGYPTLRFLGGHPLSGDAYRHAVVEAMVTQPANVAMIDYDARIKIRGLILPLAQALQAQSHVSPKALGLSVVSGEPADSGTDRFWIFEKVNAVVLRCAPQKVVKASDPNAVPALSGDGNGPPLIGLTKTVDDLGSTGDERKKADAATISVKRTKTQQPDGSTKTDTLLAFDGTLGVRLSPPDRKAASFAFANYTLSRDRVVPAAVLAAGKRSDDGDVNGLALGLAIQDVDLPLSSKRGGPELGVGGRISFISDYAHDSRRGVGTVTVAPGFDVDDLGVCGLGYLRSVSVGGVDFRAQCAISFEADYSHVFRAGRALFKNSGDFLSLGLVAGIVLAPPLFVKSGIVASATYRYLPTVTGIAPDVKRFDATLKYRWWLPSKVAIDFGGTYAHGRELKTYTMQDVLQLSFGVLY